jgi:O-antigen/teichoic acid export membrane protein
MTQNGASLPAPHSPSIRSRLRLLVAFALRDTNVVVGSVIATNLLRAISSIILTRLLMPEVFGILGVLGSVAFTAAMISDLGFQAFVVRHPDGDKPRFLDTVWTIALARAAFLTLLLVALSEPIAKLLHKPDLAPLIAVSALTFVIEGMASLSLLTALRHRLILRLSMLEIAVIVLQIVMASILAYFWRSPWAILVSMLASSALKSTLSYALFPQSGRRLAFDRKYASDLWTFARFVTGASIITLMLMQCDKLLLARFMSLDQFGLYILAGNLASAPLAFTSAYASRVLYPSYSQAWREGYSDLRALFYAKRRLPSLVYTFAAGGLIGSAPLVIGILYDHRYAGATIYLQLLALMPLFALASNASNEALTATGRIRATFEASAVKLLWLAIAGPAGYLEWGPIGLVAAVGLMEVPAVLFKWFQMHRVNLLDLRQELSFVAAGMVGIATGALGDLLLHPLLV